MEYKFKYKDLMGRDSILIAHSDLILIGEQNIKEGNFLIFTDIQPKQETQETQETQEIEDLNARIADITEYLVNTDETTIADIENSIFTIEQNKINGGM